MSMHIGSGAPIHGPQSNEQFVNQMPQSAQYKGHQYVRVDVEKGLIGLTTNSKLASTPMQVKQFMERHGNTLESGQAKMLERASVKKGKITISEQSSSDSFIGKSIAKVKRVVASVTSYIKNLGQTDSAIVKQIHTKANEQSVAIEYGKLSQAFEEKLGLGGLATNLLTLDYLQSSLSEMEKRLSLMNPESKEANDLREAIGDTRQGIADREQALRSKDTRKQMMGMLKEVKISDDDSADVAAAKSQFQEDRKGLIAQMKSLTSIRFEENVEIQVINVHNGISQTLTMPTNFADRVDGGRAIKQKGYSERGANDPSVRKHVKAVYEERGEVAPDSSKLGSSVSMSKLIGEDHVNFDQLQSASTNKLWDISLDTLKIFGSTAKEGSAIIGAALNAIIQELPNENIKNQQDLKQALMDRIVNTNQKKEMIDRELFADLIKGKINNDLYHAPEFKEAERAFKNGSWGVDEEREITFTNFDPSDLPKFMKAIHYFFNDPETQQVLESFVPIGDAAPRLASDAAAIKRGDELTAQLPNLTRDLKKLEKEKLEMEGELKAQMLLYDAGTLQGKAVTQPKIDFYKEKIAEINDKIIAIQLDIANANTELQNLSER